jgi:hypothetical protein
LGSTRTRRTLAVAAFQRDGQEPEEFTIDNDERAIRKLVRRLARDGNDREIRICYEAGTFGYTLQRRLEAGGGVVCEVVAPSLITRKPGEWIKTDRRDARKLAERYRAGVLTTVAPPTRSARSSAGSVRLSAACSGLRARADEQDLHSILAAGGRRTRRECRRTGRPSRGRGRA